MTGTRQRNANRKAAGRTATVAVIRGRANQELWEFTDGAREVVRVGSGAHCSLRLRAPDVRSNHLMLVWNGEHLAAIDTGAGGVCVNDEPLAGSRVLGSCRIAVGQAILQVSAPSAPAFAQRPRRLYRDALPDAATVAIAERVPGADSAPTDSAPTSVYRPSRSANCSGRGADRSDDRGPDRNDDRHPDRATRHRPLAPPAVQAAPAAASTPATVTESAETTVRRRASRPARHAPSTRPSRAPTPPPPPPRRQKSRARPLGKRGARDHRALPRWATTSPTVLVRRARRGLRPYAMSLVAAAVAAFTTAVGILTLWR